MSNGKLSESAVVVATDRYFMRGEDWEAACKRVGYAISACETAKRAHYADKYSEMIFNLDFLPGGRILRNSGRVKGSLFNCYVIPIGDSKEEIGKYYSDSFIVWCDGGGLGVSLSSLRPEGALVGEDGISSGPISFLRASNASAHEVRSGGSRRAAGLSLLHVEHPDIFKFIDAKADRKQLNCFNISVGVSEAFLVAVEQDDDWELRFAQKTYKVVKAREIWHKIMENMVLHDEPGLLNWDNMTKNNSYYYDPVICTNPCGEAILEPYGICNLGSLVLPNFITGTVNTNWKKLEDTIKLAVRFLDDVIEANKYVLKEFDIKAHNSRRIGIGMMGLAEYLFAKGLRYGAPRAVGEVERLIRFVRDSIYTALVELADEKGAFPKFDPIQYGKASFIRKLPAQLRMDIKDHGVRCVTSMAIAPTGTISLIAGVNSSIEPLFAKAYMRSDRISDRMYVHPLYKKLLESNEPVPDWFVDAYDLRPSDHFEIQSVIQRYVDGAVSKTINMPKGTTAEQLSRLTLEYIRDLKGVTVYVDGTREDQILTKVEEAEVREYLKVSETKTDADIETLRCTTGSCEL
jgi:ribonucleoside-diphosphate reductase alpha chain